MQSKKKINPVRDSKSKERIQEEIISNGVNKELPFYVVCDNIRSLENIGSIFRTADALNIDKIFLCGICGKPPNQKISKAALGAENWIDWEYYKVCWRLIEKLKKENILVVALEQTKNSLLYTKFKPKFPLALVIGNEIKGISSSVLKRADKIISLPMFGKKESLNVAVAFGIAAYQIRCPHSSTGQSVTLRRSKSPFESE